MKELIDLVAACPTNLKCCDFHHTKADQHGYDEACKPMDRYYVAIEQAQRRIEEGRKDNIELPPLRYGSLTIAYLCGYNDAKRSMIPEGWQLVPKEPTKEMLKAGRHINSESVLPIKSVYQAMLSAAPKFGEEK